MQGVGQRSAPACLRGGGAAALQRRDSRLDSRLDSDWRHDSTIQRVHDSTGRPREREGNRKWDFMVGRKGAELQRAGSMEEKLHPISSRRPLIGPSGPDCVSFTAVRLRDVTAADTSAGSTPGTAGTSTTTTRPEPEPEPDHNHNQTTNTTRPEPQPQPDHNHN